MYIDILLATYNGGSYIVEQLNSILSSKNIEEHNISIIISDDGSTDDTISKIESIKNIPKNFNISILSTDRVGGVQANFLRLLKSSTADIAFFADQDDFWNSSKISLFVDRYRSVVKNSGENIPIGIHSDLCITDELLAPVHSSMFHCQKLSTKPSLLDLLNQNSVTGCVFMLNKYAIKEVTKSDFSGAIMHDWYCALYVQAFGKLEFIDKSLNLYRQHSGNQVGAKDISFRSLLKISPQIKELCVESKHSLTKTFYQAKAFKKDFGVDLLAKDIDDIDFYIDFFEKSSFVKKLYFTLIGKIRKTGFIRQFVFVLMVLMGQVK
ncbi:glycosyltransferase family 2 protein [Algibacillus agarilyticus]|uniref:glycosyltransferase family 2 protein n=1 Tax=Algibacillus agarilyticus TaxID=2234133 RepID=UPI000DCFA46E|nr:glycosyltransferase family 2 protein [Algibacillus agarilyticus]